MDDELDMDAESEDEKSKDIRRQSFRAHDDATPPGAGDLTCSTWPKTTPATAVNAIGRTASCPVTGGDRTGGLYEKILVNFFSGFCTFA